MKFTAPNTREECNEYLEARIGVTWDENETPEKTLSDIKMLACGRQALAEGGRSFPAADDRSRL